jgi:hypothetical protein
MSDQDLMASATDAELVEYYKLDPKYLMRDAVRAQIKKLDAAQAEAMGCKRELSRLRAECTHPDTSERTFSHDNIWLCCDICGSQLKFLY